MGLPARWTPEDRERGLTAEFKITSSPVLDSGIGIEAGYESDQALRDAVETERAKLDPDVRGAVVDLEKSILRRMMFGHD